MDLTNILLIIVGITNLFLALIIYFNTKKIDKISVVFFFLALNVSLWSISMSFFRATTSPELFLLAVRILYIIPIFIPILFLYFVKIFLNKESAVFQFLSYFAWSIILAILIPATDKFIVGVSMPEIGEKLIEFGNWYIFYIIHFIFFFGLSFVLLINKYFEEKNSLIKTQIKFLFLGTFLSSIIGMTTNLILPWFNFFALNWVGNIVTIFFVGFILYAILKYKLFNAKIIATEIFVIFILITLFVDLFFVNSTIELIVKNLILISVVILSFLIIKSMYEEIETREKIEKLAENLKIANTQLKKMDKQKSEFVSIASHQLRGPITSLKGYSSMILEGNYGPTSEKIKEVVKRLSQSSQALALIIDDFLNLSRIERGKIEFKFEKADVKMVVESAIKEIQHIAQTKSLKLNLKVAEGTYKANIDKGKMKQIISNIIDNAVKYTIKGSVNVDLLRKNENILIKISDTGIGLPKGTSSKLFKKFGRLNNANDANIDGTGLGLYLAKVVIDAHKGKIWAESKGKEKGTTFFIRLKAI